MQLVAKYPCREEALTPHIGKQVIVVTTANETIHGRLEIVRTGEIVITQRSVALTSQQKKKFKAKLKRYPYPPHHPGPIHHPHRPIYPGYPGPIYPGYPGPGYYPRYGGAESLVLPLFLLAALYA